jgi:hypothetical protein
VALSASSAQQFPLQLDNLAEVMIGVADAIEDHAERLSG